MHPEKVIIFHHLGLFWLELPLTEKVVWLVSRLSKLSDESVQVRTVIVKVVPDMHPLQEDVGKEDVSERLCQVRTEYTALKPLHVKLYDDIVSVGEKKELSEGGGVHSRPRYLLIRRQDVSRHQPGPSLVITVICHRNKALLHVTNRTGDELDVLLRASLLDT